MYLILSLSSSGSIEIHEKASTKEEALELLRSISLKYIRDQYGKSNEDNALKSLEQKLQENDLQMDKYPDGHYIIVKDNDYLVYEKKSTLSRGWITNSSSLDVKLLTRFLIKETNLITETTNIKMQLCDNCSCRIANIPTAQKVFMIDERQTNIIQEMKKNALFIKMNQKYN